MASGFEKWKAGISQAVSDAKWNAWDCECQSAVNEYNAHLSGKAKYVPLDWLLIKAMLWVETGANSSEWNSKPMQIGVTGDPGLSSLLSDKEGGDLILPPALKKQLTVGSVKTLPAHNIRAGIGYLLMRLATFAYQSVPDADAKSYEVVVKPGDTLSGIAKANRSTVEMLQKLNPNAGSLRPGQRLTYQKASTQRVITGWRDRSMTTVAERYNGGGDPLYAQKLDYTFSLVRQGKSGVCTP